ncbi:ABC transporter permease subunit [Terrabacter aerolatus]|uniref:ABC transporter permease n=1 Tax=Terrabacter aerolatus TaxID=422442 RepID=A0A512CZG9_9MICO|nr:ABC transporter permease subunit [Terrabacter aerolatus]GEO29597.1 ABC transporter permease [Terrabacter aerolatus]
MTAATTNAAVPPRTSSPTKVTQARVVLSEWTKLRSLRSTVFSLLAAVVFVVGLAVLVPSVTVAHWPPRDVREAAAFDPTSRSLAGIFLAQLAIGVLGVLLMTGEYATGMIRATLAAVPARLPVLWAKAAVFAAATLAVMVPAVFGAFVIGQSILQAKQLQAGLGDPGVLRAVVGAALYLTVVGILGLGLGALLRNTAGGISALFGVLFVLPIIVRFLPTSWSDPIDRYLPSTVGQTVTHVHPDPAGFAPWTGFAIFCGYAAVVLALAAIRLRRRDA